MHAQNGCSCSHKRRLDVDYTQRFIVIVATLEEKLSTDRPSDLAQKKAPP